MLCAHTAEESCLAGLQPGGRACVHGLMCAVCRRIAGSPSTLQTTWPSSTPSSSATRTCSSLPTATWARTPPQRCGTGEPPSWRTLFLCFFPPLLWHTRYCEYDTVSTSRQLSQSCSSSHGAKEQGHAQAKVYFWTYIVSVLEQSCICDYLVQALVYGP